MTDIDIRGQNVAFAKTSAGKLAAIKWLMANPPDGFAVSLAAVERQMPSSPGVMFQDPDSALTWRSIGEIADKIADLALQRMQARKAGKKHQRELKARKAGK